MAKAELFADVMEEQFKTAYTITRTNAMVQETVDMLNAQSQPQNTLLFYPNKVWNIICKLSNQKAPGQDDITNGSLKLCNQKTIAYISRLYNVCIGLHYFLCKWKNATVIMLPKSWKDIQKSQLITGLSLYLTVCQRFLNPYSPADKKSLLYQKFDLSNIVSDLIIVLKLSFLVSSTN